MVLLGRVHCIYIYNQGDLWTFQKYFSHYADTHNAYLTRITECLEKVVS